MAHNIWIDQRNGAHLFVGRNQEAWHKLGTVVEGCLTWQDAIKTAGLDWEVNKERLFDRNGAEVPAWGMFRDSDHAFLGAVGERYTAIQNRHAFEWVDALIGQEGAHYDTAGALGNGEIVFCSAHLPSAGFSVIDGDAYLTYLLFKTSHDGSLSATCKLTSVRVVCQNTLNMALQGNGDGRISIRHTASSVDRLEQAKKLVHAGARTAKALQDRMTELTTRTVTRKSLESIMKQLFPQDDNGNISTRTKNNVEDILNLWDWNDGNLFPQLKGTAYQLLNAITEYTDKSRSSKGDRRAESAIFGSGEAFKEKAFDAIYKTALQDMPMVGSQRQGQPVATMTLERGAEQMPEPTTKKSFLSSITFQSQLESN